MADYMELWKRSFWLSDAARKFAAQVYKDEWDAALALRGEKVWLEVVKETAEQNISDGRERLEAFLLGVRKLDDLNRPKEELLERATKEILLRLRDGTYRAYGFDRPRTLDLKPVLIPREAWAGTDKLGDNKIRYQSLQFIDVRVRMVPEKVDPVLKAPYTTAPAKAGRPTVAPDIEAAFHALHKIGEIDPTASQMSHYPKVRKWLELNHADLHVPPASISDKTIQKYFAPLFNDLKESSEL